MLLKDILGSVKNKMHMHTTPRTRTSLLTTLPLKFTDHVRSTKEGSFQLCVILFTMGRGWGALVYLTLLDVQVIPALPLAGSAYHDKEEGWGRQYCLVMLMRGCLVADNCLPLDLQNKVYKSKNHKIITPKSLECGTNCSDNF